MDDVGYIALQGRRLINRWLMLCGDYRLVEVEDQSEWNFKCNRLKYWMRCASLIDGASQGEHKTKKHQVSEVAKVKAT